jgi:hypothetical protein
LLFCGQSFAQDEPEFEEISVFLYTRQIGGTEMPAYIHGEELYLPVMNVFSFLKILNTSTPFYDTVSGFFINQQATFLIDRANNQIKYQNNVYKLNEGDLIRTENNLYLKIKYFGEIFGLDCNFSYSGLSVTLTTKLELPLIREMRQAMMRANLNKLRGEVRPDTVIKRNYPLFHFGAADWSISSTERINQNSEARLNLGLGALIAGGEASVILNYTTNQVLDRRQQYYSWHFANNDFKVFKQITLGKIPIQSSISLGAPVVGAQISNTPTTFQRSFCTYTLSDYTEPGWIVELYVNYVLVDYIKADASGYFSFEVPLVYGNSLVKLRFYGPWGEERTREETINIPFNFLPPKRFEYTINAGIVESSFAGKYSKLNMNFGVNRRLTLGGGLEYFSLIPRSPIIPFTNLSMRLSSNMLLSMEYMFGVKFRGVFTYRLPANLLFELYYTNVGSRQQAIHANYLEERKAVVSMPVRAKAFSSLLRMTVNQYVLPGSSYFAGEFMISGGLYGISTNLTTNALFLDPRHPYVFCNLSAGVKLPAKIILTPQVQYVLTQGRLLSGKIEVEKRFFRNGTINAIYERNFANSSNTFQFGFRYDFAKIQTSASVRSSYNVTSFLQFLRGSMVYEGKGGDLKFSRNSSVGKGGIIVVPFLDINCNGKLDKGEQKIINMNLRISSGRIEKDLRDSTIHISELEPFTTYYIELDRSAFENVSWQVDKPIISVTINPNQFKNIQVPIKVMGVVSGTVIIDYDTVRKGRGGVSVSFYRADSSFVAKVMTEDDGYFTFYGLRPGAYYARVDGLQLKKSSMAAFPEYAPFEIQQSVEGDMSEGLEFVLHRLKDGPGNEKK